MSDDLFNTIKAMSKQHAENSGSYTFQTPAKDCEKCEGFGWVIDSQDIHRDCIPCNGTGRSDGKGPHYSEPEPAPTVSLYNLLDHSAGQLRTLQYAVRKWIIEIETLSKTPEDNPYYTDLTAWSRLLSDAELQKDRSDSLAWAEKTAKEITKDAFGFLSDNIGPEHNV